MKTFFAPEQLLHHPQTYLIVVDGKRAAEAPFRLKVECQTRRE